MRPTLWLPKFILEIQHIIAVIAIIALWSS